MGHFIITLPNNVQGHVSCGTVKKTSTLLNFLKGKKSGTETKKGYIVKVDSTSSQQKEYRLLKTKEGNWISEDAGGFQITPNDQVSAAIKKAIDDYESQH